MEALFIFIVKSGTLLTMFYFAYMLLLRKETFFNSSRWFLIAGLITSVVLPFVVYTKIVWVDPAPQPVILQSNIENVQHYNSAVNLSQQQIEPLANESLEINWNLVSLLIYTIGFACFMIKFAIDFYSLNAVLKGQKIEQQEDFKFIDVNENIAPFSYFDYIVYNSSLYTEAELENILEHEKVHSDQHHTIDVLISRFFCILFWFNPIIWLYKKAVLQNLEFIADREASKKITDRKAYQYTLLKITTHENCVAITNHFYQSLIKKRIVMLNKNQSKKRNYWKYYAIIPALVGFVLLFQIRTIAQEKQQIAKTATNEKTESVDVYKINKTTTDAELKSIVEKLKSNHNITAEISDVKRNSDNELINIKIQVQKGKEQEKTMHVEGNKAIRDCGIIVITDNNGNKKIKLTTDNLNDVTLDEEDNDDENEIKIADVDPVSPVSAVSPVAPIAPVAPVFPSGKMPKAPDMSKMPKAPIAPADVNDKVAMAKFEKEMDVFEKKMKDFEPQMDAFQKELEEVMGEREIVFEKDMEKYQLAMEVYNTEMQKFQIDMKQNFNFNFDMSSQAENARINAEEMKKQAEIMKQHAKEMKKNADEMRKAERRNANKI